MKLRELIPDTVKDYVRLINAKAHFRQSFIGSPDVSLHAGIGRGCSFAKGVQVNAEVTVGDHTYVNAFSIIGSGSIGKFCSIGYFCQIGTHEHPTGFVSTSPLTYGSANILENKAKWNDFPFPPQIGHDVWVGSSAHILQGVRIGCGAVIGAGAVVTRDVPDYGIAVGVPARVIRMRFDEQTVEKLLGWRWWDLNPKDLKAVRHLFVDENWTARDVPDHAQSLPGRTRQP